MEDFATAGKYHVGKRDADGFGAHNYFPANVFAEVDDLLPKVEAHLAAVETTKHRRAPTDLRSLSVVWPQAAE